MKLSEFSALSNNDQVDVLCDRGIRLASRQDHSSLVMLYQVDNFYVEIFYHRKRHHATYLRCFASTEPLVHYLDQIDISSLLLCK